MIISVTYKADDVVENAAAMKFDCLLSGTFKTAKRTIQKGAGVWTMDYSIQFKTVEELAGEHDAKIS